MPSSIGTPAASRKGVCSATRGFSRAAFGPSTAAITGARSGPDSRTTPMPPRPGAVAIATIGSAALRPMAKVYEAIDEDPQRAAPAFLALFVLATPERAVGPEDNDPLVRYGALLVAAMLAGQLGGEYSTRAAVYTGFVLWVLVGAVVMFVLAHRSEGGRLSPGRVLLWAATIWLW